MPKGNVYVNGIMAGVIENTGNDHYSFTYESAYFSEDVLPAISLTLPKTLKRHESPVLFPFFYGLLAEGVNKEIQCRLLKIDEDDDFIRLLKTAGNDTIGAVSIKEDTE